MTRGSESPLHICLVSEEFPPDTGWGGIGTYSYNLAHGLAELGHRVHVIARGWGGDSVSSLGGVTLHRLTLPEPSWRRGTQWVNRCFCSTREIMFWNRAVSRTIARILLEEQLDVIECPDYHAQGVWAALRHRHVPL